MIGSASNLGWHGSHEHPLHAIVVDVLNILGLDLEEIQFRKMKDSQKREYNTEIFACDPVPGSHVLLIEDSWASGANVLSAAAALKSAGASQVNAMVLGRLLNPANWGPTKTFIKGGGLRDGFDPHRSPWKKIG